MNIILSMVSLKQMRILLKKKKKNSPSHPNQMHPRDSFEDTAKKIGKDWFDAAIKKDFPNSQTGDGSKGYPKDEKKEPNKPTNDERETPKEKGR